MKMLMMLLTLFGASFASASFAKAKVQLTSDEKELVKKGYKLSNVCWAAPQCYSDDCSFGWKTRYDIFGIGKEIIGGGGAETVSVVTVSNSNGNLRMDSNKKGTMQDFSRLVDFGRARISIEEGYTAGASMIHAEGKIENGGLTGKVSCIQI